MLALLDLAAVVVDSPAFAPLVLLVTVAEAGSVAERVVRVLLPGKGRHRRR